MSILPTNERKMIDIHAHLIPGVDDGAVEVIVDAGYTRNYINETVTCEDDSGEKTVDFLIN